MHGSTSECVANFCGVRWGNIEETQRLVVEYPSGRTGTAAGNLNGKHRGLLVHLFVGCCGIGESGEGRDRCCAVHGPYGSSVSFSGLAESAGVGCLSSCVEDGRGFEEAAFRGRADSLHVTDSRITGDGLKRRVGKEDCNSLTFTPSPSLSAQQGG